MSIYDITKEEEESIKVRRGTGFFIDGFGHISVEWVPPEKFDKDYSKIDVERAMSKALDRLYDYIDIHYSQ